MKLLMVRVVFLLSVMFVSLIGMEIKHKTLHSPFTYEKRFFNKKTGIQVFILSRDLTEKNTTAVVSYLQENFLTESSKNQITFFLHEPIDKTIVDFWQTHYKVFFLRAVLLEICNEYQNTSLINSGEESLLDDVILYTCARFLSKESDLKKVSSTLEKFGIKELYQFGLDKVNDSYKQANGECVKSVIYDIQQKLVIHQEQCHQKIMNCIEAPMHTPCMLLNLAQNIEFQKLINEQLFNNLRWNIFTSTFLSCISQLPDNSIFVLFDYSTGEKHLNLEQLLLSTNDFEKQPVTSKVRD